MDVNQDGAADAPVADEPSPGNDPVEAVQQAVAGTSGIDELPVGEHVTRFETVHGALSDALSSIDEV